MKSEEVFERLEGEYAIQSVLMEEGKMALLLLLTMRAAELMTGYEDTTNFEVPVSGGVKLIVGMVRVVKDREKLAELVEFHKNHRPSVFKTLTRVVQ